MSNVKNYPAWLLGTFVLVFIGTANAVVAGKSFSFPAIITSRATYNSSVGIRHGKKRPVLTSGGYIS